MKEQAKSRKQRLACLYFNTSGSNVGSQNNRQHIGEILKHCEWDEVTTEKNDVSVMVIQIK